MAWLERRNDGFRICFHFSGQRFTRSLLTHDARAANGALARLEDNLRRIGQQWRASGRRGIHLSCHSGGNLGAALPMHGRSLYNSIALVFNPIPFHRKNLERFPNTLPPQPQCASARLKILGSVMERAGSSPAPATLLTRGCVDF
jgi:hypothetical protein